MDNRRQHVRRKIHLAIEVMTDEHIFTGSTVDVSRGGLAIEIDGPVYGNSRVQIGVFKVVEGIEDDETPVMGLTGDVVWARAIEPGLFSAGVRFDDLGAEEEHYLATLIGVEEDGGPMG